MDPHKKKLLISHHPDCMKFDSHIIPIGKHKFCIGCFVGYPSALIGAFSSIFIFPLFFDDIGPILLISAILCGFQIISYTRLDKMRKFKILQKIIEGFGVGIPIGLVWAVFPMIDVFRKLFLSFIVISIFGTILQFLHYIKIVRACDKCTLDGLADNCSSEFHFRKIIRSIQEENRKNRKEGKKTCKLKKEV